MSPQKGHECTNTAHAIWLRNPRSYGLFGHPQYCASNRGQYYKYPLTFEFIKN